MPMNTANKLTLLRVFLIPVFLVVAYWGFPGSRYVALAIYIVACLTDLLDGYIARHYNQVSDFGKFADPLADKCLVMAALCWFVETGDMVGWVLAAVLLEEPPQAVSREAAMPAAIRPLRILLLFFITLTPLSLNWVSLCPWIPPLPSRPEGAGPMIVYLY